jgi:predicted DCC family thiol-disulfide oxidoreductase YuxK
VSAQAIVLYDHDCGFCRWSLGVVLRWDRGHRLWPAPIAGPVGGRWLAGMPTADRLASWHLVEHGVVTSAGRGVVAVARYLPGGWALPVLAPLYGFVARHRSWFAKPLRREWVEASTALIAERSAEAPPSWASA